MNGKCLTKQGIGYVEQQGEKLSIKYVTDLGSFTEVVVLDENPELRQLFMPAGVLRVDQAFALFAGLDFALQEMRQ